MGKTKWPTRGCNSKKHKPYNGKKKMDKKTNNGRQSTEI